MCPWNPGLPHPGVRAVCVFIHCRGSGSGFQVHLPFLCSYRWRLTSLWGWLRLRLGISNRFSPGPPSTHTLPLSSLSSSTKSNVYTMRPV
jgi:hypothetical protein